MAAQAPDDLACFPPESVRICNLSGVEVSVRRSRLLTLNECRDCLNQCIREAERARQNHELWRAAELAARIVLVACDVAIAVLEEKTGPAGMVVGKAYSGGRLVVDAFSGHVGAEQGALLLMENKATIASLTARHGGYGNTAKAIDRAKNLVSLATTFWSQVTGASTGAGGAAGIESSIRTLRYQLERLREQIAQLERDLANC